MAPPLLPLGDPYWGECTAQGGAARTPEWQAVRDWCNMGYARGQCPWFPEDGPDAVRFAIGPDSGERIRVRYAVERRHEPAGHGELEYDAATRTFTPAAGAALLQQAGAYVESYLRRRTR